MVAVQVRDKDMVETRGALCRLAHRYLNALPTINEELLISHF